MLASRTFTRQHITRPTPDEATDVIPAFHPPSAPTPTPTPTTSRSPTVTPRTGTSAPGPARPPTPPPPTPDHPGMPRPRHAGPRRTALGVQPPRPTPRSRPPVARGSRPRGRRPRCGCRWVAVVTVGPGERRGIRGRTSGMPTVAPGLRRTAPPGRPGSAAACGQSGTRACLMNHGLSQRKIAEAWSAAW